MSKLDFHHLLLISELYQKIVKLLATVKPPGFRGISLLEVVMFFINELKKDNIWIRSAAMAYHFFLALFPALIFLLTLIPYVPINGLEKDVEVIGRSIIPPATFGLIWPTVKGIVSDKKAGLLSFSFILTLFLAAHGVYVMMVAFYKDSLAFVRRDFVRERLVAILLVIIETLVLILTFVIHFFGKSMIDFLVFNGFISHSIFPFFLSGLKWFIVLIMVFFGVSIIYYIAPSVIKRWLFISPGSIIAFLLITLATGAFFYYVSNFANYNKIYGSLGAIVILMIWFYWISFAILIGFELNTSIDHAFLKRVETE